MKSYRFLSLFLLIALATALTGCGSGDVEPGDRDFPQANPQASNVLEVHGTLDPSLPVKFAEYWITRKDRFLPVADGNCNYYPNTIAGIVEGVDSFYTVRVPLKPTMHDGSYQVEMKTDAFLPGRCGWTFAGLLVYTDGQALNDLTSVDSAELLVEDVKERSLPNWADMIHATGARLDVSCEVAKDPIDHPNDSAYLRCVEAASKRVVRVTLRSDQHSFELNIHRENRSN